MMNLTKARTIVKINNGNSKMPGSDYSQDSFSCNVGSRLAKVKDSVCSGCYAQRLQKLRPCVDKGWKGNLTNWRKADVNQWIESCVYQINHLANKTGEKYHRWFASGDIDSLDQLIAISDVCKETPDINHWLPTREIAIVREFLEWFGSFPDNLIVRVSSPMIGDKPLNGHKNTSTVHRKGETDDMGHICPAPTQGGSCGSCRACWDVNVSNVSYKKH